MSEPTSSIGRPRAFGGGLVLRRDIPGSSKEAASFDREIARLLRWRLMVATGMLVGGAVATTLYTHIDRVHAQGLTNFDFALSYGLLAVEIVLLLVLLRSPDAPLGRLRMIEMAVFGVAAFAILYAQFRSLHTDWYDDLLTDIRRDKALMLIGDSIAVPWIFLIVLYGVFIPNTWRRCAAVVGVLAATPLAVGLLWRLLDPHDWRHAPPALWLGTAFVLLLISAVAVHGSHKIHVLAERAFEARKLGQYHLIRKLGSGGMGEVYLAEHQLLRRQCAVKLIRPEFAADEVNLKRFEREVKAMAELVHPNTAQVYDYGQAEGTFYYAMEYLPGLNLEELVRRVGPLPPGRAVHLLRQVAGALGEAHGRGLIHRDVKPGNILLCRRGGNPDVVKLLDFGLVKHATPDLDGDLTMAGGVAGTPAFMSPEQAAGRADLDARSDLYSVGAVAYFLISGRHVFVKDTLYQVMAAHQYEKPAPLREVWPQTPPDLAAVVMRCLEKSPADRYPDAASLEQALAGCACTGEWTPKQASEWWDAAGMDEQSVAMSESASTLMR